ncbi:hypothetical protein PG999_004311 [Apiospora kogelbergensis]|uniref:Uncharacterized protein n=1 Tax=Apiospora kogelbergensis TaxID=1337665 RepID=A0AAW0QYV5_9PEZI
MAQLARALLFLSVLVFITALEIPCHSELKLISKPQQISAIDILFPGRSFGGRSDTYLDLVHERLGTCPEIRNLDLSIDDRTCSPYDGAYILPLSPFKSTKYAAALESLKLRGYDFADREANWVRPPSWRIWRNLYERIHNFSLDWYHGEIDIEDVWDFKIIWEMGWKGSLGWAWYAARCSLPGAQCHLTSLELWTRAMDFSKLQHLTLAHCHGGTDLLVEHLIPKLTSLRGLALLDNMFTGLFLALGQNTLERISFVTHDLLYDIPDKVTSFAETRPWILHHSESLRSLEWRVRETLGISPRPMIPLADLRDMHTLAPNLQELSIDLDPNGTWPWEMLDAIVEGAPASLKNLTMYLQLASDCKHHQGEFGHSSVTNGEVPPRCCTGIDEYRQPALTVRSATAMFEHLMMKTGEVGKPGLTAVTFRSGYWGPRSEGMLGGSGWLESQRNGNIMCTPMLQGGDDRDELRSGPCSGSYIVISKENGYNGWFDDYHW